MYRSNNPKIRMLRLVCISVTAALVTASAADKGSPLFKKAGLTIQDMLQCSESKNRSTVSSFNLNKGIDVLGYVTPWNSKGYTVAETFSDRMSFISPVLYQLRQLPASPQLVLAGGHDYDGPWIARVKATAESCAAVEEEKNVRALKIVPRVLWEINRFLTPQDIREIVRLLAEEAQDKGYDGFTLEFPIDPQSNFFLDFIKALRHALGEKATLVIAIMSFQMPTRQGGNAQFHVTPSLLRALSDAGADRFSVMTYDYGGSPSGAPNSPLPWIKETVESLVGGKEEKQVRRKILIGLPWYGYMDGQAVVAHEFVANVLQPEQKQKSAKVEWDDKAKEHIFTYSTPDNVVHTGTYPTPAFFQERLKLVQELGVAGIAIWELGQGLDCFPLLL